MIKAFSPKTIEQLKYYVYIYSDPDTKAPFYIGKGKGNRAFDHLSEENGSEKIRRIQELHAQGKEPLIEILVHGVEDENTILKIEAAAIDLIGIENLTNCQRGHDSSTFGKIEASLLEARYSCEELLEEDFEDNVILFRINQKYYNEISPQELYEITRGYWKVDLEKASKANYALAVYDGMVIEVYEIMQWFPAYSTMMWIRNVEDDLEKRNEFVGRIADESIRQKYIDKSVASVFKKSSQNPVRYILPQ